MTLVSPCFPRIPNGKFSIFQMVVMFFSESLRRRYWAENYCVTIFHKVLNIMEARLSHLIMWPDRETLHERLPSSFRHFFKSCCVIIDCSEVFIDQPSHLCARAQVWSNYKHHFTIKFLIRIISQGTVSYLSCCAGRQISDKMTV